MNPVPPLPVGLPGGAARLITCLLPDNGTDRRLLRSLREDKGIARADTMSCRGTSVLHATRTRHGALPEPNLLRMVTVIVEPEQLEETVAFIAETVDLFRQGAGLLYVTRLDFASALALPADLADETD